MRRKHILTFATLAAPLLASMALGQSRFATVYTFTGANPVGLAEADDVLYGATNYTSNCGTVFELQPPSAPGGTWTLTTLYAFANADGCGPTGPPVMAPSGALYGVAYDGGPESGGTAYELQPPASPGGAWTESVIYSFTGLGQPGVYGGFPEGLILSPSGSLYIPTENGGADGEGAAFELTPPASPGDAWTATLLYSFGLGATGDTTNSLSFGPKGILYGTNEVGTTADSGTVFELSPPSAPGGAWTETTLYTFQGFADGAAPNDVIPGPAGTIYGTTLGRAPGSENGIGSVFQLTPPTMPGGAWTKTILKSFGYSYNCGPDSPLILRKGNLYGAACQSGGGVVFELQPPTTTGGAWTYTALHTFTNGQRPSGAMVMTENGKLYGTTYDLSGSTGGTLYEIVP